MSLEPAVAAVSGLVFLHEQLAIREWIAVVLIIVASAGAATGQTHLNFNKAIKE